MKEGDIEETIKGDILLSIKHFAKGFYYLYCVLCLVVRHLFAWIVRIIGKYPIVALAAIIICVFVFRIAYIGKTRALNFALSKSLYHEKVYRDSVDYYKDLLNRPTRHDTIYQIRKVFVKTKSSRKDSI
jgi:hypothetical protein